MRSCKKENDNIWDLSSSSITIISSTGRSYKFVFAVSSITYASDE